MNKNKKNMPISIQITQQMNSFKIILDVLTHDICHPNNNNKGVINWKKSSEKEDG